MTSFKQNDNWLTVAKRLPLNTSCRIRCCRDDSSAIVSSSLDGYSAYCFRCGEKAFKPRTEAFHYKEYISAQDTKLTSCELPKDCTNDMPPEALVWLRKSGIDADLRELYNITFSPRKKRVIIPLFRRKDNKLIFIQARAVFEGQVPKYSNVKAVAKPLFFSKQAKTNTVVITEDILSAIKVGQVYSAISILGTKIVDTLLVELDKYDKICIWLDPDEPGIEGALKLKHYCSILGKPVYRIQSDKDPKYYSKQEIKNIIGGYCGN